MALQNDKLDYLKKITKQQDWEPEAASDIDDLVFRFEAAQAMEVLKESFVMVAFLERKEERLQQINTILLENEDLSDVGRAKLFAERKAVKDDLAFFAPNLKTVEEEIERTYHKVIEEEQNV